MAVGVVALAASTAAWLGTWRGWTRTFITAHLPAPLTILPAFGFLMVAFGLRDVRPFAGSSVVVGCALLAALAAAILALWNPPWLGPAWFREMKASGEPVTPDLSDPLTASTHAMSRSDVDARAPVVEKFGQGKALASWRVSLDDAGAKIGGHLELHPDGIAFYPNEMEARMRAEPFAVTVPRREVSEVRRASRGFEVRTASGTVHRFEAFFPRRIVARLAESLPPR